jgi:hypothetical protein
VRGVYSHVSLAVEQRLVDGLERRWGAHALRTGPNPGDNPSTRKRSPGERDNRNQEVVTQDRPRYSPHAPQSQDRPATKIK